MFFAPFLLLYRKPWSKSLKLEVILSPSVDAVDAKFSICNLQSISQAGRRRFDPGLPLHLFNNLQAPRIWPAPKCSIYITVRAFSILLTATSRRAIEERV